MKKIFLLSFILSLTALTTRAAYDVPYFSTLVEDSEVSSEWTVVDADENEQTVTLSSQSQIADKWAYPSSTTCANYFTDDYPAGVILYENVIGLTEANDRLVSPAINLEAGKEYRVRYAVRTKWAETTTFNPLGSIYLVAEDDLTGETPLQTIETFTSQGSTSWKKIGYVFTPETTGAYRFVYSITIRYKSAYCCFTNFQVVENEFVPSAPTGVTTKAGTEENARALSVTLKWTNPTADSDGIVFSENQILEKINIYRDGGDTPVGVVTDGATSWTDTEADGLTNGYHTYQLEAVVAGVASQKVSVATNYVGTVLPLDLPCSLSLSSKDDFGLLWSYDNNGTTSASCGWQFNATRNMASCYYLNNTGDGNNCWLFSPALNFPAAGTYQIVLNGGFTAVAQAFKVAVGQAASIAGMTQVVAESLEIVKNANYVGADTEPVQFTVAAPGVYYIGIMSNALTESGGYFYLNRVDVTMQAAAPLFSPEAGTVVPGTKVAITSATEGAKIYYTLDGSVPTTASAEYDQPIEVTGDMTIKAIAVADGYLESEVAAAEYTVIVPAALPTFDPESGEVEFGAKVTIASATEGAKIYYTLDESVPTTASVEYDQPIELTGDMTIKAIAVADGYLESEVATAVYTVKKIAVPGQLYIFGIVDEADWNPAEAVEMTKTGNEFVYVGRVGSVGGFAFTEVMSSDWNTVDAARWGAAEGESRDVVLDREIALAYGSRTAFKLDDGYYEFKVVFSDYKVNMMVTAKNDPGRIEGVMTDEAADAEYFNLQGVRVFEPAAGNIYIVRRGSVVTKEIFK